MLTEGFAAIAWSMEYLHSGVMSFLAGSEGPVLQKDLGEDTASRVQAIGVYDPGEGWEAAEQ